MDVESVGNTTTGSHTQVATFLPRAMTGETRKTGTGVSGFSPLDPHDHPEGLVLVVPGPGVEVCG